MKQLLAFLSLLIVAFVAHGANPDYRVFRGSGGILVTTNPPTGLIVIDGSGVFTSSGTNATLSFSTNGVLVAVASTNMNVVIGNNMDIRATNAASRAHYGIGIKSNLSFFANGGELVFGTWGIQAGWSNAATGDMLISLPEVASGNDLTFSGVITAPTAIFNLVPGVGDDLAITSGGSLMRTNITNFSTITVDVLNVTTNLITAQFLTDIIYLGGATVFIAPPTNAIQYNSNGVMQGSASLLYTNGAVYVDNPDAGSVGAPLLRLNHSPASHEWDLAIDSNPTTYYLGVKYVGATAYAMVWELGGNVGIGTTNPANRLDVEGRAAIGATYSGNNTAPTDGLIVEGRVGITTASPTNALDVNGHTSLRSNLFLPNLTSNASPVAVLATDADGRVYKAAVTSGSGASVAPPISSVQFNSNGVQRGSGDLTYTNGQLLIDSTEASVTNAPTARLAINQDASHEGIVITHEAGKSPFRIIGPDRGGGGGLPYLIEVPTSGSLGLAMNGALTINGYNGNPIPLTIMGETEYALGINSDGVAGSPVILVGGYDVQPVIRAYNRIPLEETGTKTFEVLCTGETTLGIASSPKKLVVRDNQAALCWAGFGYTGAGDAGSLDIFADRVGGYVRFGNMGSDSNLTEHMRILSTGRVGIGMTNPTAILAVSNSTATTPSFAVYASNNPTPVLMTASNGFVGIGTAAPSQKLTVAGGQILVGPVDIANAAINLYTTDYKVSVNNGLELIAFDKIRFLEGATERLRIESGGNVGIAITSPTNTLDVNGHASIRTNLFLPNLPTNGSPIALLAVDGGGKVYETALGTAGGFSVSGNSNQIGYLNAAGTAFIFGGTNKTAPGFGFSKTAPANQGTGSLLIHEDETNAVGLVNIGKPNYASDISTYMPSLNIFNRYAYSGSGNKHTQEMVRVVYVDVSDGSDPESFIQTWRHADDIALSTNATTLAAGIRRDGQLQVAHGTYYPSNSLAGTMPSAAQLGPGGFWVGNSNASLVTVYSLNGSTTAMKVLAP